MRHKTPSSPSSIFIILFWKCSGALEIPKGSLLKQYLPWGVMNVVKSLDYGARGICQNPLLKSNLLKTFAPVNCARVSSTRGSGWTSLSTLSFNGFKSTQIRMDSFFFGTTTIPAHHMVGSSTSEMTSSNSILSSLGLIATFRLLLHVTKSRLHHTDVMLYVYTTLLHTDVMLSLSIILIMLVIER